ncbi:uncharacterized protein LOC143620608 [Bidens hawaiensis]|uniref:uncharacterized protein LOC143620608 n=1 Tax=Bidens hawaiensis TaxID=980011 RepID=UPI00404A5F33
MATSELDERSPSFFKVIRDPSSPLSLPKAFVRRYFEKIPKSPILVSVTGKHSWRVEFEKIGEEYCFGNGWEKLVEDVGLCVRDVVIFWMIDAFKFCVSFLGVNGCEKDLPVYKISWVLSLFCFYLFIYLFKSNGFLTIRFCRHDDDDDGDEVMEGENLCYKKVFRRSFRYYMRLPVKFVKAAGLEHPKSITLKDPEGKEWTMGIHVERYRTNKYKYCLTAGWSVFRKYHKLSDGDVLTFVYNKKEGVLNLTRVFKCEKPIKQEAPMGEVNTCYGGGNVKIGDEWSPIGGGRGGRGGVEVKVEYESGPETELTKRKRGMPQLKTFADVKIEDGWDPEMVGGKRREVSTPEKPSRGGGVEVNNEPPTDGVFRCKRVVYF